MSENEEQGYLDSLMAEGEIQPSHGRLRSVKNSEPPPSLGELISDLPDGVSGHCVLPEGYSLQEGRLYRVSGEGDNASWQMVAGCPIVVSGLREDATTGAVEMEIAYRAGRHWRRWVAAQERLLDSGTIIRELGQARYCPVNASNKSRVATYLQQYQAANVAELPIERVSGQMGWVDNGQGGLGFVLGDWSMDCDVKFAPPKDAGGVAQLAKAVQMTGDPYRWRDAIAPLNDYPVARLAVVASLAAPLLELSGTPNFVVDWSARTSTGKTSVLRVGASVWGRPDERHSDSMVMGWDATEVAIERTMGARNHLPTFIDDTKRARKIQGKSIVPSVVYSVGNGQGRARGTINGLRETQRFRTILLTTSEGRVIDESRDGGAAARVISLARPPFGKPSKATAKVIDEMWAGVLANYGTAGDRWLEMLAAKGWNRRGSLAAECKAAARQYVADAPEGSDPGIVSRVADYMGLLHVCNGLAEEFEIVPWSGVDLFDGLIEDVFGAAGEGDRTLQAVDVIASWTASRAHQFLGTAEGNDDKPPHGGWLGKFVGGDMYTDAGGFVGYFKPQLLEMLRREGFDADAVVRDMYDRKMLVCDRKGSTKVVFLGDKKSSRMVCVKTDTLGLNDAEES